MNRAEQRARQCRILALRDWPARDLAALDAARRPGDFLEPGGPATRVSARTLQTFVEAYAAWLGWLREVDELDVTAAPAFRVTEDRLRGYVEYAGRRIAPATLQNRLIGLYRMIEVLDPEADVSLVKQLLRRLGDHMVGRRRDAPSSAALLQLGLDLMTMAEAEDPAVTGYPNRQAGRFRDGLMIALLSLRPLRRRNFAGLEIGRHLVREGERWRIHIPAGETKTRRALDYAVPPLLRERLERYLTHYRPVLASVARKPVSVVGPLWLSARTGLALSPHAITLRIVQLTERHLRTPVNPHRFRHAAATTMAIEDPEHVGVAMAVNGHVDPRTMQTHYNLAGQQSATLRYQEVLAAGREGAQARRGRGGRTGAGGRRPPDEILTASEGQS